MLENDSNFKLYNSAFISNLAQIKHVFIDKTRTMTTGEFDLIEIQIQNQVYQLNQQDESNNFFFQSSQQYSKQSPPELQIEQIIEEQNSNGDSNKNEKAIFEKFIIDEDIEEEIEEGETPSKTSKTQTVRSRDIYGSQKNSWTSKSDHQQKQENNDEIIENQKIGDELFAERDEIMIDPNDKKKVLVSIEEKNKKIDFQQRQLSQLPPIYEESPLQEKGSALSIKKKKVNFYDKNSLKNQARQAKSTDMVYEALLSLILCHQANKQINSSKQTEEEKMWFENREELEIIRQAKEYGFVFEKIAQNKRRKLQYQVKVNEQKLIYEVLGINDYTEHRKRFLKKAKIKKNC